MKYAVVLPLFLIPLSGETLHYAINWPSGLSLGEATLQTGTAVRYNGPPPNEQALNQATSWNFSFDLDASIPGFSICDRYVSHAEGPDICSTELTKTIQRGSRRGEETDNFDQKDHTVTRQTKSPGGKSDYSVSPCARDALAFLQFARNELASGRLAPQQSVVLGGMYRVRLEFSGSETIKNNGKATPADRIQATITGASSDFAVQILFSKDMARTPLLVRIPLALGTFTAELAP